MRPEIQSPGTPAPRRSDVNLLSQKAPVTRRHHLMKLSSLTCLLLITLSTATWTKSSGATTPLVVPIGPVPLVVPIGPVPLVEIALANDADAVRLTELGLDILEIHPGRLARVLAWPGDIATLDGAGLSWRIIEPDYGRALAMAAKADAGLPGRSMNRDRLASLAVPPPGSGSFGGWYSLAEVYAWMDSLVVTYPGLCDTLRIGTSRQARAIRAFRITDENQPAGSRPRVLYTSLTHAREPGGMQALIEFMKRLIEGYEVDPDLTYLVNSREIWFVPVVNPDGYEYNRQNWINTGSFGLWRKNLRDNNGDFVITNADGVDLNRNFGFRWGHDNIGSSPTASSATYRGPSAFSEPETRALRDFSIARGFTTADNYHTYAEICIYPWGYIAPACPDSTFLTRMVEEMQAESGYAYGTPGDLLYTVNGDANDWMYGEQVTKPKILPVTIEAGDNNDGFWPPASRIVPLAREQHRANTVLAYAAGTWVHADTAAIVTDDGWWHPGNWAGIRVRLRNDGVLSSTGAVSATASTSVPGITIQDAACQWPVIATGGNLDPDLADYFRLLASPSVLPGTRVPIVLDITDQGGYVHRDTIEVTVGTPLVIMSSNGAALTGWTATGTWGIQTMAGNAMFSDSPSGKYADNASTTLTRTADLDLSGGMNPVLTFRTLYDFERGYDAGRVEVSINGGANWTIQRGRLGRRGKGSGGAYGGGTQELGQTIYDGTQRIWGEELIDLSAYQGLTNVRLRFRLTSDSGETRDGWKIDDVAVRIFPIDVSGVAGGALPGQPGAADPSFNDGVRLLPHLAAIHPNPVGRSGARITAEFPTTTAYRLAVYDVQGRLVEIVSEGISAAGTREFLWRAGAGTGAGAIAGGGASASASGVFYLALESAAGRSTERVAVVH